MTRTFQLNKSTAFLIYAILLSGVIGVLFAFRMTPKDARKIHITLITPAQTLSFSNDPIHYKLDSDYVRLYANGQIYLYPTANISSIQVEP